jgi:hypothetical protein
MSESRLPSKTHYYIVRPNDKLLQLLSSKGNIAFHLTVPKLWTIELIGRTFISSLENPLELKLLFVAEIKSTWRKSDSEAFLQLLHELLPPPLGIETFDTWWTIERIQGASTSAGWAARHIEMDVLTSLSKTGNEVCDGWLEELISKRLNNEF